MAQLRSVTCHMGSHSVTCHPTQVNTPALTPAMQAGTRFGAATLHSATLNRRDNN